MLYELAFYEDLGRRICKARKSKRLTQDDLALMVSLTRTSITNLEKGRQRVQIHKLVQIAHALQVNISLLLPEVSLESTSGLDVKLQDKPEAVRKWIKKSISEARKDKANASS